MNLKFDLNELQKAFENIIPASRGVLIVVPAISKKTDAGLIKSAQLLEEEKQNAYKLGGFVIKLTETAKKDFDFDIIGKRCRLKNIDGGEIQQLEPIKIENDGFYQGLIVPSYAISYFF